MIKKFENFLNENELNGKRIRLISMENDPQPIEPGEEGTVDHVDDLGTIFVKWDNGRSLGVVPEEDEYEILNESESIQDDDMEEWFGAVASYLEIDYEIPSHDEILDTFLTIVNGELEELFDKGIKPAEAAGIVAANEDAMEELYNLMEENDDEDDD